MPVRIPVALLVLAAGVTCGVVALTVSSARPEGQQPGVSSRPEPSTASSGSRALVVLRAWDERRARAWAAGDVAALRGLYVQGSAAGAADVSLLQRYLERGAVVPALRMQLLRAAVLVDRPRRVVVRVVERLASQRARIGARVVRLPRDSADLHVVELRRDDHTWRVAAVTDPAAG